MYRHWESYDIFTLSNYEFSIYFMIAIYYEIQKEFFYENHIMRIMFLNGLTKRYQFRNLYFCNFKKIKKRKLKGYIEISIHYN